MNLSVLILRYSVNTPKKSCFSAKSYIFARGGGIANARSNDSSCCHQNSQGDIVPVKSQQSASTAANATVRSILINRLTIILKFKKGVGGERAKNLTDD